MEFMCTFTLSIRHKTNFKNREIMKTFDLKKELNFNGKKQYCKLLNENIIELGRIKFDEVYEGYEIKFTKHESCLTENLVWFEASSNEFSSPNVYKTLDEMLDLYNEWKNELINK
jgi:hypothetical protein